VSRIVRMTSINMEANPTQIINYFNGFKQNLFFQRPYTWAEKQWRTLWDDIISFYDEPPQSQSTNFMGAVVNHASEERAGWRIEVSAN
jgi:uncharacterized protein with ParB-like and HNH nuclease domain